MLGFLVLCNVGRLEMIFPMIMYQKQYKVKEILCRKFSKASGIEIQIQDWFVNRLLSLEVIAVQYFLILIDPGSNEKILIPFIYI